MLAFSLVLLTIAVYLPAIYCGFVSYDDDVYVTANVHVLSGLSLENIEWAFIHSVSHNWHPLTMLSLMLDCSLFGLQPWGHHLVNVLLHAGNTLLVFLLLRNLTGAIWRSATVAALFGIHPAHVESVAWIAERKDVLSACFGLLSLMTYVRYAQKQSSANPRFSPVDYALAFIFFGLSLMSKPMLVTWPFVMMLLDYWPLRRWTGSPLRLLLEKIPFLALSAAVCIITLILQKYSGDLTTAEPIPLGLRAENAIITYGRYLQKLLWPDAFSVFYPYPSHFPLVQLLSAGSFILGISLVFLVQSRRHPFLFVGWAWFLGTLIPVIGLIQAGGQAMADRYIYIPSVGIFILTVWGTTEIACHWRNRVPLLSAIGLFALALCGWLTQRQLEYWQDSESLFQHALAVGGDNHLVNNDLGVVFLRKGRFDDAADQFQRATRSQPDDSDARNNLGTCFLMEGRIDDAKLQFQNAISINPNDAHAHYNLGFALDRIGAIDDAIKQYRITIRLKPDNGNAHNNLGLDLVSKNDTTEAISEFKEAIRLKPDFTAARKNLDYALSIKNGQ